ncbi:MAG: CDP-diacylglycerol--glycerol-3-phosphate 3-phosphatidyltransferase [Ignavibacteriaceae bacterium]|nr:CDP-diacylglycerol--glycerol-3-phosphate 3-phosphatidyltransferase [Ignavibacteriaceae bacterium]
MVLPNQLTVLRIILTPVFIYFFLQDDELSKQISLGIYVVAALTDWYDGWLARKFNYITSWGKFWDPLADKILTAGAFLSLVYLGVLELWMIVLMILRDFIVTIIRGYADYKGASFPTSRYAKWKTFFQMFFLYYILVFHVLTYTPIITQNYGDILVLLLNHDLIYYSTLVITLITVHSGVVYIYANFSLIKKLFD